MKKRSGFGWLELVEGILLILLSIYTIIWPDRALTGWIVLYGLIAVIMGVADILLYIRVERFTGFGPIVSLVSGALSVMTGVMLLVYPNAGKWVRLLASRFTYWFTLVMNVLGLVLGVMMLARPWFSLLSLEYLVSFYLMLLGVDCIILACSRLGSRR